jgi:hypothetical protein
MTENDTPLHTPSARGCPRGAGGGGGKNFTRKHSINVDYAHSFNSACAVSILNHSTNKLTPGRRIYAKGQSILPIFVRRQQHKLTADYN